MPGCGKSLTAKGISSLYGCPLLALDLGSVMSKYVGESEEKLERALAMADYMGNCVLWIDEIEKAFAGVSSDETGITQRLFGKFLTWMQEKKGGAFVVATANDLSVLPPEFLRRGRFDEIFSVDFPDKTGIAHIFKIHINKKKCDKDDELLNKLDDVCGKLAEHEHAQGCAGSDIEAVVNNATEKAWRNNKPLSYAIIAKELDYIKPLAEVLKEKIEKNREKFGQYQLRPAKFTKGDWQMFDIDGQSDDAKEAAGDERCPAHILERFAKDGSADVKRALLENPSCPPGAFAILAQDADADIKASAEGKLTLTEEGQVKIAKEGTTEEKLRVCKLPTISGTAQLILAKDPDTAVRRALLAHQYLTTDALTKLAEWKDEAFRELILKHPIHGGKAKELTRSCKDCFFMLFKYPQSYRCRLNPNHYVDIPLIACNKWAKQI
jgi:hypothetical protein